MHNPLNWHEPHSTSGPHRPGGLPLVELEIVRGRARQKFRRVEAQTYLIGSAADCDLVLADAQFADVHAYLLRGPRGATVRWLGCPPDLTVNGRPADAPTTLVDGDRLRTGPYEFKVHVRWPTGADAADARDKPPVSLRLFAAPGPAPLPNGPSPAAEHCAHQVASASPDPQHARRIAPSLWESAAPAPTSREPMAS